MKKVSTIAGRAAPLPRNNVDTDQIMPKQHLKRVERSGFGPYVFYDWRYDEEGEPHRDFVLNQTHYQESKVLNGLVLCFGGESYSSLMRTASTLQGASCRMLFAVDPSRLTRP